MTLEFHIKILFRIKKKNTNVEDSSWRCQLGGNYDKFTKITHFKRFCLKMFEIHNQWAIVDKIHSCSVNFFSFRPHLLTDMFNNQFLKNKPCSLSFAWKWLCYHSKSQSCEICSILDGTSHATYADRCVQSDNALWINVSLL